MTALPTALSIVSQTNFSTLWHPLRTDRRMDERHTLLAEAILRLETKATADGYPTITSVASLVTEPIIDFGPLTGQTIVGTSLHGSRGARSTLTHGTGTSQLDFEAVIPGVDGDDITITITETGASLCTADVDAQTIVCTLNGEDADGVAALINGDAAAKFLVNVTSGGAGAVADLAATALSGGAGTDFALEIGTFGVGGASVDGGEVAGWGVTEWTNTTITVDVDPSDVDEGGTDMGTAAQPIYLTVDGVRQFLGYCTPRESKQLAIDLGQGDADGGTWAWAAAATGLGTLTRTAADATDSWWVTVPVPAAGPSGNAVLLGVNANYSVDTADLDEFRVELWAETPGADGSAPTAAVLFGDDDADYDAAHNTTAERIDSTGAPEEHFIQMLNAGALTPLAPGVVLKLRIFCDGSAGGDLVVKNAVLVYAD